LRHGGSALIDRKDPKQAIPAIKGLHRKASPFPEGTRGKPKAFAQTGLKYCKSTIGICSSDKYKQFLENS
jgi:1-acyl-sn-glycerol-3-phosphate acyltransferase